MTLRLNGSTSGYVEIDAPATAGSNTLVLPTGNGSANQLLKNGSTAGTLGWSSMVEDSSGRLGIGTSSPGAPLSVLATSSTYKGMELITPASDGSGEFIFGVHQSGDTAGRSIVFKRGGSDGTATESCRIDADGRLLVGTTSALSNETGIGVAANQSGGGSGVVEIRNTVSSGGDNSPCLVLSKTMTTTSSSARFIQFYANNTTTPMGGIVGNGASNVQFATLSDIRDKENIEPLAGSLDKVKLLEVVSYDWKNTGDHVEAGFIAQNVETVFPEYVVDNMASEGQEARKGITGGLSSGYVAVLTAALQEAVAKIETQDAAIAALETRLAALEAAS